MFPSYICVSLHQFHTLLIKQFSIKVWNQGTSAPQLCSFSSCFSYARSSAFPCELENQFANFYKIVYWDFDLDCNVSLDQLWENWHFNNISLPTHKLGMDFCLFRSFRIPFSIFFSFQYLGLAHFGGHIYFYISYFWCTVNGTILKISIPDFHCYYTEI